MAAIKSVPIVPIRGGQRLLVLGKELASFQDLGTKTSQSMIVRSFLQVGFPLALRNSWERSES